MGTPQEFRTKSCAAVTLIISVAGQTFMSAELTVGCYEFDRM